MFKPVQDVQPAQLNLTDEELANHIYHEFPNLQGSLRLMFERFSRRCAVCVPVSTVNVDCCPKCGTKLEIFS